MPTLAVPVPTKSVETQPFWEAATENRFMILRCLHCDSLHFAWNDACPTCHSSKSTWVAATGKGKLYSYVIAHQRFHESNGSVSPIIGIIELDEGPLVMSEMTDIESSSVQALKIGTPAEIVFSSHDGETTGFAFRLV